MLYCHAFSSPRESRSQSAGRRSPAWRFASVEPTSCTREGAVEVAEHGEVDARVHAQQQTAVWRERGAHDALRVGLEGAARRARGAAAAAPRVGNASRSVVRELARLDRPS